jgi:hypothetical protein
MVRVHVTGKMGPLLLQKEKVTSDILVPFPTFANKHSQ